MKPLTPASPHAIIVIGIPGSGKSSFAEHFAETFKAPIVNTTAIAREADLNPDQAEIVAASLLKQVYKSSRTFLVEGDLDKRSQRLDYIKDLKKLGFMPLVVWVQTDTVESQRRATRPYPKGSGLTIEQFDQALDSFEAPDEKEKAVVISGKHTFATQLKVVLRQLALHRAAVSATSRVRSTRGISVR